MKKTMSAFFSVPLALAFMLCTPSTHAATIDLTGQPFVTYGDGQSTSLPISEFLGCTTCNVLAGPGQIDIYTKLGLGANGQLGNSTPGMDDAFDTPQANTIDGFRMGLANEPTPTFTGDRIGWWDATLAALNSKLNLLVNSIVFFFANNEIGTPGSTASSLAAYARIELTGPGLPLTVFELTNDPDKNNLSPYGAFTSGGGVPNGSPSAYTSTLADQTPVVADFLQSGGRVCIGPGGTDPCFEHNLGGDRAAYAITSPSSMP